MIIYAICDTLQLKPGTLFYHTPLLRILAITESNNDPEDVRFNKN